jgi:ribonucleoside-triphosphate reductase
MEELNKQIKEITEKMNDPELCLGSASVWSRITGYWRPIEYWNIGKKQEYQERIPYLMIMPN